MKNYKICIIYGPTRTVENCFYRMCKDSNHAKNIGKLILKDLYGMRRTPHQVKVELVKNYKKQ